MSIQKNKPEQIVTVLRQIEVQPTAPWRTWASHRSAHMDETTTAPTTSGRAASGGGRLKKMGGPLVPPWED